MIGGFAFVAGLAFVNVIIFFLDQDVIECCVLALARFVAFRFHTVGSRAALLHAIIHGSDSKT